MCDIIFQWSQLKSREKRSANPSAQYTVVGTTIVRLTSLDSGIILIRSSSLTVQENDVLGFQYYSQDNPVKCSQTANKDWQVEMMVGITSDLLSAGAVQDISLFSKDDQVCGLMALYFQPTKLTPSKPYLDKSYYNVGQFTFSVHAKNAISQTSAAIPVNFLKKVNGFTILINDTLYKATSSNNSYDILLESDIEHTFLIAISSGTDVSLHINSSTASVAHNFSSACPAEFIEQCKLYFKSRQSQFTMYQHQAAHVSTKPVKVPLTFVASNKINQMQIFLVIQTQARITNVNIKVNTSSQHLSVGDVISLQMHTTSGSHIIYTWSYDTQEYNDRQIILSFHSVGKHVINAVACNQINCGNASFIVYVLNEAHFSGYKLLTGPGAYKGETATLYVIFDAAVWSEILVTILYGDGTEDNAHHMMQDSTSARYAFNHVYRASGIYSVEVSLEDSVTNRNISISESIIICERLNNPTISGSTEITVLTNQRYDAHLSEHTTGMQYEWDFGDGSANDITYEPSTYHVYSITASFSMTVKTLSCVGALTASISVSVQQSITGFELRTDHTILVGHTLNIELSFKTGSNVAIKLATGTEYLDIHPKMTTEYISYTYNIPGTYNLTATAYNAISMATSSHVTYVHGDMLFQVFDLLDGNVLALSEPTLFTAIVIHPNVTNILYEWDFDDGATTTDKLRSVNHTYNSIADFNPSVVVSAGGIFKSFSKTIHVKERVQNLKLSTNSPVLVTTGRIHFIDIMYWHTVKLIFA